MGEHNAVMAVLNYAKGDWAIIMDDDFQNPVAEVSKLIKDVEFSVEDFQSSMLKVEKGDFVYLDPPYAPESASSFVGYTKDGFNYEQHVKLFNMCDDLVKKGFITTIRSTRGDDIMAACGQLVGEVKDKTCLLYTSDAADE